MWQVVIRDHFGDEADTALILPHLYATEADAEAQVSVLGVFFPSNAGTSWAVEPVALTDGDVSTATIHN